MQPQMDAILDLPNSVDWAGTGPCPYDYDGWATGRAGALPYKLVG